MHNDLISRRETIKRLRLMGNPHNNYIEVNIKEMPTAYDIEKVIENLKKNECITADKWNIAENIIRNGKIKK